jgi:hypothetical protein
VSCGRSNVHTSSPSFSRTHDRDLIDCRGAHHAEEEVVAFRKKIDDMFAAAQDADKEAANAHIRVQVATHLLEQEKAAALE